VDRAGEGERTLQELADVKEVKGRNWYGLWRLQTDAAEDVEDDARVLNATGGWKHTETRERYQQEGRAEIDEKARDTRAKIRPKRRKGGGEHG